MSESISDLLAKRSPAEPPEVQAIKKYVREHIGLEVSVSLSTTRITIGVPSAAAAGSLRMHLHELQQQLNLERRLVIRIG